MRSRALPLLALAWIAASGAAQAGPVEDARALLAADRPEEAFVAMRERTRERPDEAAAFAALGEAERLRCRLEEAQEAFRRAIERDPADGEALAGLAETLWLDGRPDDALAAAQRGVDALAAAGREEGRLHRARALALVELRRYDLAVEAARRAVALAPDDAKCAETLAAALFRAGRMDLASEAYLRATRLDPRAEEANLRLGNGFGPATQGKPWRDGEDAPAFDAALAAWDRGDLGEAQARFLDLARRRPHAYKYRLGTGLARLSARRRREALLGGDPTALYLRLPAPEVEGLEQVVPGVEGLGPAERHVVLLSTAPARPLWDALRAAGARHEVFPLEADLTDAPERRDLAGRRTFDGRWYEHLRGVGGPRGATGEEKLREAAEFGFNTFAHEFGHQVLRFGLSRGRQDEVQALFEQAVARGACLDYYAAENVDEYFAQSYEAFVSFVKRGCLPETARHTRDELAHRDPAMLAFLLSALDTSHERGEAVRDLRAAAGLGPPRAPPAPRPEPGDGR